MKKVTKDLDYGVQNCENASKKLDEEVPMADRCLLLNFGWKSKPFIVPWILQTIT